MTIRIQNLCFSYKGFGANDRRILQDLNLDIDSGELLALVGASGSGKTTFMQHLTGLLKPDTGRILIDDVDLWSGQVSFTQIRRRIGLVFQFPEKQLFEETVFADVAFGPRNLGLSDTNVTIRVQRAVEAVGLDFEAFKDRVPFHLSEGEKRRVAIAGVLAMEPEFLVLDEPTAGLDPGGIRAMVRTLKAFHAAGNGLLLISHNLDLVVELVDRIVVLAEGKVCFDGHKTELFGNPDLLQSVGLSVPRIVSVTAALKKMGLVESAELWSWQEIKEHLARVVS